MIFSLFFLEGDVQGALQFYSKMFRHVFLFHVFCFGNVLASYLWICFFHNFWKVLSHYSFKCCLLPLFIYFLSKNTVSPIFELLIISSIYFNIFLIFFVSLSSYTSFWEISSDISFSLLIHSSAMPYLLFNLSTEFFIS